ncbi:MAG: RNA-binding domain-containing protein [Candidatus Bathyarchaeia archaeon]
MASKVQVGYIDIRVFAHATEDPERVLTATRNTLSRESIDTVTFKKVNLTGHHGNPIILYETKIKEKKQVQAAFEKLCSGLSILDKEILANDVKQHLDKGNLYVRLDKQSAFLNELKLSSTDPIHLRIHFKKHSAEEVIDICRRSGLLP